MATDTVPVNSRSELIRRLGSSTFNYWFGYVANVSLVIWLVSHAFAGRSGPLLTTGSFVAFAATGLLSWTLSEYLLHRYLYHVFTSFLSEGHELHHRRPRALIGVPWYLTTIAIIGIFEFLGLFLRPSSTGVVMGFNWLGYIIYCVTHHGSHHWRLSRGWLGRMKRHHLIHHAFPEYNWGFTTPLWDHVFGTYTAHTRGIGASRTAAQPGIRQPVSSDAGSAQPQPP